MARSKLAAILQERCPRCREGKLFKYSPFNLKRFDEMPVNCRVCGLQIEVELGFFWGAMYISYAFSVGLVLLVGLSLYNLANDPPMWVYVLVVTGLTILFLPFSFRYARVLMLHLFGGVEYDPQAAVRHLSS